MAQSGNVPGGDPPVWRAGTLGIDELERLAGEIRPSWEIGLDAVDDGSIAIAAAQAIVPTSSGFTAAPSVMVQDLGGMNGAPVVPAMTTPFSAPAPSPSVRPAVAAAPVFASKSTSAAVPIATSSLVAARPAMAYDQAKTVPSISHPWEDDASAAPRRSKGVIFGGVAAGIAAIGLIAFFALRGGEATSTASQSAAPAATTTTPAIPSAPVATTAPAEIVPPTPVAPVPPPRAVEQPVAHAAPPPAMAVAPPPARPPVVAVAPARPTPPAAPAAHAAPPAPPPRAAPVVAARNAPPPAAARAAPPARAAAPARATRRVRAVGFVTDSPY